MVLRNTLPTPNMKKSFKKCQLFFRRYGSIECRDAEERAMRCSGGPLGGGPCPHTFTVDLDAPDAADILGREVGGGRNA